MSRSLPVLLLAFLPLSMGLACSSSEATSEAAGGADAAAPQVPLARVADFQEAAARFHDELALPRFERSPEEVASTVAGVIARADERLRRFAAQDPAAVTFESSIAALDEITYPVATVMNRMWLMKETQQDEGMRIACTDAGQRLEEWSVGLQYREDVYAICKAFADAYEAGKGPRLQGEDQKLYHDTMRDYRRAGFELDAATREKVSGLLNDLHHLETEFDTNITDAKVEMRFAKAELAGCPESFLKAADQGDGSYLVRVTVTPDYLTVMQNCSVAATRKSLNRARYSVVMDVNGPLLDRMLDLRRRIATLLGYDNWADYRIEPKMAHTAQRALDFCEDLVKGLQPKFDAEVAELRKLKAAETGDPKAQIDWWDFRYYQHQLMKQRYQVDTEALRVYFQLDRVIEGMFEVYQRIFGLRFVAIQPDYEWVEDLRSYVVLDAASGEPLGIFFLDLFPREGKYNHFAQFDIVGGKRLANGIYRRPVAALVCNFTPGVGDQPSLMSHDEVETIFHEFGHCMHTILTRAKYQVFAGGNVPRDFVEAPSQMFENWVWDPAVLRSFAVDYRDPSKTIPMDTVKRMKEAKLATIGIYYRRQLALALSDLRMHVAGPGADGGAIANRVNARVLFQPPANTNFCAYWGHLTGYDAGYYGYAWAASIAADLATAFENAPNGFLDRGVGARLRKEIYEVGGSRPVEESIHAFLGRDPNNQAFLKSLGIR